MIYIATIFILFLLFLLFISLKNKNWLLFTLVLNELLTGALDQFNKDYFKWNVLNSDILRLVELGIFCLCLWFLICEKRPKGIQ
jgi:hypothetical protein